MKPVLLRSLETPQTIFAVSEDYQLLLAPRSSTVESQIQFQACKEWSLWSFATKAAGPLVKKLEDHQSLLGCLIDHRMDFDPQLYLAPDTFAVLQTKEGVVTNLVGDKKTWSSSALPAQPLRVIGGSRAWIDDLGRRALEDIIIDSPREIDMTYLLFSIAKEWHFLGFEDPTPFLFGVDQFQIHSLS